MQEFDVAEGIDPLNGMVYPGRVILVGCSPDGAFQLIAYALTGRSPSSQARRIVHTPNIPHQQGRCHTEVIDDGNGSSQGGNPALLYYDCMHYDTRRVIVTNGAQTSAIVGAMHEASGVDERGPVTLLTSAMAAPHIVDGYREGERIDLTMYEPDAPHYTPRISAIVGAKTVAMHICRRAAHAPEDAEGEIAAERRYLSSPLLPGKGWLLTTYQGPSASPLPSFTGGPAPVVIRDHSPKAFAERVFHALAPAEGAPDLRVSVIALAISIGGERTIASHAINRHEES